MLKIFLTLEYEDYVKSQSRKYGIEANSLGFVGRIVFAVAFALVLHLIEK